jgi:two-component system sensor histidine kinase DesK
MAARTLVCAYLGCVLVSKLADGNEHPDFRYVPFVAVCFVLPFWYVSGRARGPWLRWPWLLLLAQCAVTYLGFAVFQDRWVGGVSGLLGGLVLLVVRSPWSWWLFGLLAGAEISVWLVVGLPYQPPVNAAGWVLIVFGNVSMGLFGLTRLASLVERLESTQDVLAGAAVMAQRLATANDVRSTIMRRLEQLGEHVRNALTDGPAAELTELQLAGEAARAAAASARHIVTEMPARPELGTTDGIERVTPALARWIVAAVVVLFGVQYLLNLTVPSAGGATANVAMTALAVPVAVTMVLLQLRHARFRAGGELPPGWPWTLGAQAVLCFVAYPVFGVVSTGFLAFLGGSILLLIERPIRWVLFGAVMASMPMLTLLNPADLAGLPFQLQWSVYAASTLGGAGLLIYGLSRFNRTAGELDIARRQLAVVAVTSERLRIAQDAHDTLGLGLSTIALKSDLAQTLLDRGDPRAHREIVHMLHLARTVASDAESIVHSAPALDLDAEIATAREVLTTAGVTTTITRTDIPLDATTESELAAVLREAITNILRHSAARECRIELVCSDSQVSLVIDNDGAPPGRKAAQGHGLANIAARAARMGGSMSTEADGNRFILATHVPSEPGTTA